MKPENVGELCLYCRAPAGVDFPSENAERIVSANVVQEACGTVRRRIDGLHERFRSVTTFIRRERDFRTRATVCIVRTIRDRRRKQCSLFLPDETEKRVFNRLRSQRR